MTGHDRTHTHKGEHVKPLLQMEAFFFFINLDLNDGMDTTQEYEVDDYFVTHDTLLIPCHYSLVLSNITHGNNSKICFCLE